TSVDRCRIEEAFVRVGVGQPDPHRHRGRRTIGRVAVYRPIVAHQGCRAAVPQNGTRGALPLAGRGRIRTAGSRRDASPVRSLADVIAACGGTLLARLALQLIDRAKPRPRGWRELSTGGRTWLS